jgi:hypothetical protein
MHSPVTKNRSDGVSLSREHSEALTWFADRTGSDISWPKPLGNIFLLNKAKGIQKPEGWTHALSIRKSLRSNYDDLLHWNDEGRWFLRSCSREQAISACPRHKRAVNVAAATTA